MGKITHITDGANVPKPQQTKKADGQGFKKALNSALEPLKPAASQSSPANALGGLGELAPTTLTPIEPASQSIFDRTNFLLDKLDNYSRDLEDPAKTLKDIEPLIATIQDDALKLLDETEKTGTADTELQEIVNKTALTARMEYMKFNRGDYI